MTIPINLLLTLASVLFFYCALQTLNNSLLSGLFILCGIGFIVNPFFVWVGSFKNVHFLNKRYE